MFGGLIGLAICGRLVPDGISDRDTTLLARTLVLAVLWCLSAYALAGITRQTALGIVVPLVSGYIVENLVRATLGNELRWLGNVLPWSNGLRGQNEGSFFDETSLTGWGALAVFAVWVSFLVAAQSMLFVRRDA